MNVRTSKSKQIRSNLLEQVTEWQNWHNSPMIALFKITPKSIQLESSLKDLFAFLSIELEPPTKNGKMINSNINLMLESMERVILQFEGRDLFKIVNYHIVYVR